ncbi:MAG: phosphate/phosphite/phosphonate ABC transporter substrate-binding protein, partial [Chloroflexi bacterium]|nr:phosphate/phosphite/phosphonate ABC transporter substrate-binding protein [Chloroflexota bacterium]
MIIGASTRGEELPMRRSIRASFVFAVATMLVVAACGGAAPAPAGGAAPPSGPKLGSDERPIVLAITPSAEVQRLSTTGNAIAAALALATGLKWRVTVPTSYAAQIDSVCSGQTDIAFIAPLQMTLLLDKGCGSPILAALRQDFTIDPTGKLQPVYMSQIVVRTDSGINTIADLKGKRFAFVDALSASGFLFPALTIKNKGGQEPKTFFSQTINAGGHPQAILAVYNKQVDGAASFVDARVTVAGTTTLAAGMPADILTATKVIEKAGPIPNDGIAVSKNVPAELVTRVKKALMDYGATAEGKANYKTLFAWDGLQEVDAKFYDGMREAAKLGGVDVAA